MNEPMKSIILFGAGQCGLDALCRWGFERIAFFCDNTHYGYNLEGIRVISFEELIEIHSEYKVIVTVDFFPHLLDIRDQLNRAGIPHEYYKIIKNCMHVYRDCNGAIRYEYDRMVLEPWVDIRFSKGTVPMLEDIFRQYCDELQSSFSAWFYGGDWVYEADQCRRLIGEERIFAYATSYALKKKVISIPDYKFYYSNYKKDGKELEGDELFKELRENEAKGWKDKRAFWAGNVSNSEARYRLEALGESHTDKLCIKGFSVIGNNKADLENYTEMSKFAEYKYLIDVRGYGWTDRVKLLLAMGRPLFLVDRPYVEYYYSELEPMKDYVPVKEDLSDLIEKIDYLDNNPDVYKMIVQNAILFAERHFSRDVVLREMFNIINS